MPLGFESSDSERPELPLFLLIGIREEAHSLLMNAGLGFDALYVFSLSSGLT